MQNLNPDITAYIETKKDREGNAFFEVDIVEDTRTIESFYDYNREELETKVLKMFPAADIQDI